jgi:hypothetical protein
MKQMLMKGNQDEISRLIHMMTPKHLPARFLNSLALVLFSMGRSMLFNANGQSTAFKGGKFRST